MLKSIVMMDLPIDDIAPMERWYYEAHSSEISRRYGPFLQRHESYVALDAPEDARRFGFYNWRVTETYWREMPEAGARGAYCFTPAPVWNPVATCTVKAQPDNDFFGWDGFSTDGASIRWYILLAVPPRGAPQGRRGLVRQRARPGGVQAAGAHALLQLQVRAGGDPAARACGTRTPRRRRT